MKISDLSDDFSVFVSGEKYNVSPLTGSSVGPAVKIKEKKS